MARHSFSNYHYFESRSSWIHSAFMQRIQFACQKVTCFLIVGLLGFGTRLANHLSLEYLVPVVSILCLQQTLGSTLSCCYKTTLMITPLSIFLFIVQQMGLGDHDYLATELLLLITSFYISYGCIQATTKRIALLYNVIYFVTNFSRPTISATFSFELLAIYITGMAMSLLVSLLIFPLFATFDIENRFDYALAKLQHMHTLIIQAFLCRDKMGAQMSLARATMVETIIRKALIPIQTRLDEARFEPARFLQRIINRKHRHIIDLTLQEQENLLTSLICHVCSLQLMVTNCSFNDFHDDFTNELESSLLHLSSCQSIVISNLISSSSITKEDFVHQINNLQDAFTSIRSAYTEARLHRVEHVLQSATTIQSDDNLSHAFFLFHLEAIIRLLTQMTISDDRKPDSIKKEKMKTINLKEFLKLQWPRVFSSLKSVVIIGVGSIFVLIPALAAAFENGHLIFVTLCVTQGDTVGGAFTTMKWRLIGTLLGATWAYITYLLVHDNAYQTLAILSPWIFLCGYMKLVPNWAYTATIAAITPIMINLARLPYGKALPAGDFALLRIEQSFIGITIAAILTLLIFPIFAIDLLKDSIQTTLKTCQQSIISMHFVYDQLFHHHHSRESLLQVEFGERKIESSINTQRCCFYRLIRLQQTLVEHASLEPALWWLNNAFSTKRYNILVQQQIITFRMLHDIDVTLMRINEYSESIEHFQLNAEDGNFLPNLHKELSDLSKQLNDCFHLWISYFTLTQTRFHQLFRHCTYSHRKLIETDLSKHEQCLIDLYQTIHRLQVQHQERLNRSLQHYLDRLSEGDSYSTFIPFANSIEADSIFIAYYALYYSINQLTQTVLTLGETIHTIFELETTHLYRPF